MLNTWAFTLPCALEIRLSYMPYSDNDKEADVLCVPTKWKHLKVSIDISTFPFLLSWRGWKHVLNVNVSSGDFVEQDPY